MSPTRCVLVSRLDLLLLSQHSAREHDGPPLSNHTLLFLLCSDRKSYAFIEEYPLKELHRLEENTGVKVEGSVIAFVFEYGRNFSGPGKDPFREDRASSSVNYAYESNFLHPVYYHFEKVPNGKPLIC